MVARYQKRIPSLSLRTGSGPLLDRRAQPPGGIDTLHGIEVPRVEYEKLSSRATGWGACGGDPLAGGGRAGPAAGAVQEDEAAGKCGMGPALRGAGTPAQIKMIQATAGPNRPTTGPITADTVSKV